MSIYADLVADIGSALRVRVLVDMIELNQECQVTFGFKSIASTYIVIDKIGSTAFHKFKVLRRAGGVHFPARPRDRDVNSGFAYIDSGTAILTVLQIE